MIGCPAAPPKWDGIFAIEDARLTEPLQHGKLTRRWSERKCLVNPIELGFGQLEIAGARVLLGVLRVRSFRHGEQRAPPNQEP
jgi:hypothetical protein